MNLRRLVALATLLTLLLAVGTPVSAEEAHMNALQTALSSTTVSGYVDTSIEWTPGDGTGKATASEAGGDHFEFGSGRTTGGKSWSNRLFPFA